MNEHELTVAEEEMHIELTPEHQRISDEARTKIRQLERGSHERKYLSSRSDCNDSGNHYNLAL